MIDERMDTSMFNVFGAHAFCYVRYACMGFGSSSLLQDTPLKILPLS